METPTKREGFLDALMQNPFAAMGQVRDWIREKCGCAMENDLAFKKSLLPHGARQALGANARFGKEEILSMINAPVWEDEAVYLLLKALDTQPSLQKSLLQEICSYFRDQEKQGAALEIMKRYANELPEKQTVLAGKLAQVSRQGGAVGWRESCKALAQKMKDDNATPCLIAYSMLTGLRGFVEVADDGDQFMIIIKHKIREKSDYSLYLVTCNENSCAVENWKDHHNGNIDCVHLCDDSVHTGQTLEDTRKCLQENASFLPKIDEKSYWITNANKS